MFRSTRRRECENRKGTLTVEMAFVAPVILLLVLGSFEFARMMMVRQAITNAAREGCRHACLVSTLRSESVETVVRNALRGVIADAAETDVIRIEVTPGFSDVMESGTLITTTVEARCDDVSWLPTFLLSGVTISASTSMTRE